MSPVIKAAVVIYIAAVNLISFLLMGIDKRKAIKHAWRIPEATLFLFALVGGSIGSIAGMYVFRHKTKHMVFVIGMPLILILHIVLIYMVARLPVTITLW